MTKQLTPYITERTRSLGISQSELCRLAAISRQTLHTLMTEQDKLPTLQTVMAIASALHVHPLRLLQIICDERVPMVATVRAHHKRGDKSAFVRDVSYPDGALVLPGQRLLKTWELQNVGNVPWQGRWLQCMDEEVFVYQRSGEQLHLALPLQPDALRVAIPDTAPGDSVQISVGFTAPNSPGTVLSYWKATHADGRLCYPGARGVWAKVLVSTLAATASETGD